MTTQKPVRGPSTSKGKRAPKREIPIWEKIIALGDQIPPEELARHPRDGAANLDHYLYGVPKQDAS